MTAREWERFTGKLSKARREFAQAITSRCTHILETFRSYMLADLQKVERRVAEQKQQCDRRYDTLSARIAALERDADGT